MGLENRKCKVKVFGVCFVGVGERTGIETVCLMETCAVRLSVLGLVLSRAKGVCVWEL